MRFQVTSKLIRPNSWITQTVRQRIPNCWARIGKSTSATSAATDARNDELTVTGGSQMLATRNRGDRHSAYLSLVWSFLPLNSVMSSRITIAYLLMALKKVTELLLHRDNTKCVRLPDTANIFRAELYALLLAIDVVRRSKEKNFVIFFWFHVKSAIYQRL